MENWPPKPCRPGPDYTALRDALDAGKVIYIEHRMDCNVGQFFYVKTIEQLNAAIGVIFSHYKAEHEAFIKRCEEGVVYDGLIFTVTDQLLVKAKETDLPNDLYDYIREFRFVCARSDFVILEDFVDNVDKRHLSPYPSQESVLKQLHHHE